MADEGKQATRPKALANIVACRKRTAALDSVSLPLPFPEDISHIKGDEFGHVLACRRPAKVQRIAEVPRPNAATTRRRLSLLNLAEGPYLHAAMWLDVPGLCQADATCRTLRKLHCLPAGPWLAAGNRAHLGVELETGGKLESFDGESLPMGVEIPQGLSRVSRLPPGHSDWKGRYRYFHHEVLTFSAPFHGSSITNVINADEVVYCRCRLRTDLLQMYPEHGLYVEVEVAQNADNLSLAVVDFEAGGRSSVTFSPETGAVLCERKVRELPRAIEGSYVHVLPAAHPECRFEGSMGLYLRGGHLAFFRRWSSGSNEATGSRPPEDSSGSVFPWETTGFVTDLTWAQGHRLSVCLAFRDEGPYRVQLARVGQTPPLAPHRSAVAFRKDNWNPLYGDDDHALAI